MKRINLIPLEAKKTTSQKWLRGYFVRSSRRRLVGLLAIGFVLVNFWQATSLLRYKLVISQGKKSIAKLQAKITHAQNIYSQLKSQRQAIDREAKRIEERFKVLQEAQVKRPDFAKIMARLSTLVPEDLWINKIKLTSDIVNMVGTTFDNAIVSKFMAGLDKSGYFNDTSFNYTQKAKINDNPVLNFEIYTHIAGEKN